MSSNLPTWLAEAYIKWGRKVHDEDLKDWTLSRMTGMTRHKCRQLVRLVRENGPPTGDVSRDAGVLLSEEPESTEELSGINDHHLLDRHYVYDEERDVYITFIKAAKKPLVMPGDKHRAILNAYSNWDGQPSSLNEVSRDFGIPRPWLVEYLRTHQVTHDREPFSAEDVARRDVDEMVEDALQQRRAALYQKYEAEKWKRVKADARKWMEFEETVFSAFCTHIETHAPAYSVPRVRLARSERPYALVMGLTDFHWGAYSWMRETGDPYNRTIAEERLRESTEEILNRLPGQPEKIILPVGSDFFHVDGDRAQTTSGTPQDVDGTPTEILITGCEMTRTYVDLLRQVAPVEIVMMSGNHDRVNGLAVLMYLAAWYRDADDVTVVQDYKPRVYSEYGNTLIAFSHGDGAKPKDLGPIMATEARAAWGRTRYHVAFGGHLHHQHVHEINGIIHYLMPSLSGTDRWHSRQGYTTAQAGMCAYLVDRANGVTGTVFAPVDTAEEDNTP